jgi:zinc transport system ATP-binding protein
VAQLTCNSLNIGYDGKTVLKGLNFSVNSGDYLCIVGENGSGKSTLMKTILHLLTPLEGSIVIENSLQPGGMGYLPQQTVVQKDFPASVGEIVLSGCLNRCGLRPYYNREEKQLSRENMEKMGISHLSRRCYRELSGGQQQRVLLARALCAAGKILLLDEPVSGLDPKATAEMYELIRKLNEESITIIMISHDISAAVNYASHILHLGNPYFFGTKDEYLSTSIGKGFSAQDGGEEA